MTKTVAEIMRLVWNALDKYPTCAHDMAPWKPLESALRKLVEERDALIKLSATQCAARASAEERAERAEAEVAALRKDAERYRWLRDSNNWSERGPAPMVATCEDVIYGDSLDAAIDAALAAKGEQE